ncbi:MAG: c-type cytochrome [Planctomycetes bacterium]|nr:c-type cytochrome [Planctomycetota bacterium]
MRTAPSTIPFLAAALLLGCADPEPARRALPPAAAPTVAGLERAGLAASLRGAVLQDELGCTACHAEDATATPSAGARGPRLAEVGRRLQPAYLARFLAAPRHVEPGTPMPDLLGSRDEEGRRAAGDSLAHYLRSFGEQAEEPTALDASAAERGRELFHAIGCAACHAPRDAPGAELPLAGSTPLGPLPEKYTLSSLRAFLEAPHEARPSGRMPSLALAPGEADDLARFLLGAAIAVPRAASEPVDPQRVREGRALFAELRCAACHELPDPERTDLAPAAPLAKLDATRGCLGDEARAFARYALSAEQRAELSLALRTSEPPSDASAIERTLVARQCLACHEREGLPARDEARERAFQTSDPTLGEEGRVPPALTQVGAKLQPRWLREVIAHGTSTRPYLRTRMPAFGTALAEHLSPRLERVDALPPLELLPLPEDDAAKRAMLDLGRDLVGDRGMSCITCHTFAGEKAGSLAALDLVETTGQRLQPNWFLHYLREPLRLRPNTLMPQFFPGGISTRPELGGGDVQRQTSALWHYLAEGRNVRKPSGLRRPPIELAVGSEAVLLRRSVQNTGKRGISVGLPLGVHYAFDAERLALRQIWWGRFLEASGVFTSQGSGEARPLGEPRVLLPEGPAIAELASPESAWPSATRRELGQRWLGYELDAAQRPTFRYVCAEVEVADALLDRGAAPPATKPSLQRTLRFTSTAPRTLQLLVARAERIEESTAELWKIGSDLRVRAKPGALRVRDGAGGRELLATIEVPAGTTELVLEYLAAEEGR